MQIIYDLYKDGSYKDWVKRMWEEECFSVSQDDIVSRLHVSRDWINQYVRPAVDFVKYSKKSLMDLGLSPTGNFMYFSEPQLREFLINNSQFTKQTRVIDVSSYFPKGDGEYAKLMEKMSQSGKMTHLRDSNRFGFIHPYLLDELEIPHRNVDDRKRSGYPHHEVAAIDYWDKKLCHPSEASSMEMFYRTMFCFGYTKVRLFGKTIFIAEESPVQPMTISY